MEYFLSVGMGLASRMRTPKYTDFVLVINGNTCTPCKTVRPYLSRDPHVRIEGVAEAWSSSGIVMLQRKKNEGMDFAAHNVLPST